MSPRHFVEDGSEGVEAAVRRVWIGVGLAIRDARLARRWPVRALAAKAETSLEVTYRVERGQPTSVEAMVRCAAALGMRIDVELTDPRRPNRPSRWVDPVHSAMGEFEASHLRRLGVSGMGIDEPYQHFQYAGRADFVAWDLDLPALLHIENRTRFPDIQETAGAYNAKRAYLGQSLAGRLGIRRWASETHVICGLWSSEVLHVLRLRSESFRALCPDALDSFSSWWSGSPPSSGTTSTLVVLDPLSAGRQRPFVGLDQALVVRSRHRGYADVAGKLMPGGGT
jgi:hypothetical protein